MLLPNLIGSLLALQGNGIGDEEIKNIEQYCLNSLQISISSNITEIYYEVSNYDDCFAFYNNKIVMTEYYLKNNYLLKKRFFDVLSEKEKKGIYALINII